MIFEQHYLDCLSQASYFIGDESTKRAVVVDPRRDIQPYLDTAAEHDMTIELVMETHFHADFLSGHLELAAATGAQIGYGSIAETEFESRGFADGERVSLGDITLEVRHTPGHTPESISIVVFEHADDEVPYGVLTGDTLFIGDVGRPDLLSSRGVTSEELASDLFDSLRERLMTLPPATRVYPAHGAGSACGKNLSTDTWSTIGDQLATNYALTDMSKDQFIDVVTEGQTAPPAYFSYDANLNRENRPLLDEASAPAALDLADVVRWQRRGAVVLDTRDPVEFVRGHLMGSINIGMAGRYAEFAGGVIQPGAPIVLVVDEGLEREAKNRLARIGFDLVVGHLVDPIQAFADHPDEVARGSRVDVVGLETAMAHIDDLQLVDVRQPGETADGVIEGAIEIPLTQLNVRLATLDASKPTIVYCAGGFRSSIAASRMAAAGFTDVSDLLGGFGAWESEHDSKSEANA
ncbi:MAG: rhodanese-like domain-containing protein [Actinomycetota bacterium]|nr:rhodanese-like domain-containing protein [Actinomycetota bacterium]